MDKPTPFDGDDTPSTIKQVDPDKNYYEELVGDDKKYKDDAALARSKVEGDNHISQLERELRGIRDELKSRVDMETLVTELKELSTKDVTLEDDPSNVENQTQQETVKTEQTPEQIEQLVNSLVEKREETNLLKRNLSEVTEKLSTLWGTNAEKAWIELREELNMSETELRDFASNKPQAVLKLAGTSEQKAQVADDSLFSTGNIQSTSFANVNTGVKNFAYYERIRKSDPVKYWEKEMQKEIHAEAIKQQESFYAS